MIVPPTPTSKFGGMSPEQIAEIRRLCLSRLDFFAVAVLGLMVTPFHASMIDHWLTVRHGMLLAPRGSGKSKILDKAWLIWRILNNPELRICIASKTGDQCKSFLTDIKQEFESNADLRMIFGDWVGDTWNEDQITVSKRTKILKEPTIVTKAIGSGIPGYHFDIILADDICDLANTATEHQRKVTYDWFFITLKPTLEPDTGEFKVLGTRYNADDLYGALGGYKDIESAVVDQFGEKTKERRWNNKQFGPNTKVIPAITINDEGEEVSFWESKFSLAFLREEREANLLAFNLAYQNDATVIEGGIIFLEDLTEVVWRLESELPPRDEMAIYQGIDPAIGQKQSNDFFAHCTIGVCGRHIYILELILIRLKYEDQVNFCIQKRHQWGPDLVGIEVVAYQQALSQSLQERDIWFPVHEIRPNRDKTFRAKVFSQFTSPRYVHFHVSMHHGMEVLAGMPNVKHDDAFDAIDHAVTAAKQQILGANVIAIMPHNFRRR